MQAKLYYYLSLKYNFFIKLEYVFNNLFKIKKLSSELSCNLNYYLKLF